MTKQVTIKTCYILALLWLTVTVPSVYGTYLTSVEYIHAIETGCTPSVNFGFMVCPSTTDFDPNGVPYVARESDGTTVMYSDGKRTVADGELEGTALAKLVLMSTITSLLGFAAYAGLNSHYKWIQVNFKSCEKQTPREPDGFMD